MACTKCCTVVVILGHILGGSPTSSLITLQWRHNERDGVSNHQPHDCLLNCLFRHRSKKTSKLRVPGHCAVNSPVTGEFPSQMTNKAENVSICWRHHDLNIWFSRWRYPGTRYSIFNGLKAVVYGSYLVFNTICSSDLLPMSSLTERFMGPTCGPSGADRTQVGPMLAPWTLLSRMLLYDFRKHSIDVIMSAKASKHRRLDCLLNRLFRRR